MLKVYDFKCTSCGAVSEHFVRETVDRLTCTTCNAADAVRMPCAPISKLEGLTGHFPDAAAKWERDHVKNGGSSRR